MNRQRLCRDICIILFLLFLSATALSAAQEGQINGRNEAEKQPVSAEKISKTDHAVVIGDEELAYTAVAGELPVKQGENGEQGTVFYVAYEVKGRPNSDRPITFAFNGGPGAASVWLHLGGLGPRRIELSAGGKPLPPPVRYSENPCTWLEFTDLVFIDPVGTGFSRSSAEDKHKRSAFWGVQQDIEAAAEFIRLYLVRNRRWTSPKYLVGESYGTTRVSALTWYLHQRYGIDLNAAVLISPVLDFDTILFHPSNDLPYLLFLPSYAAAAWYHRRLPGAYREEKLGDLLKAVETFCLDSYSVSLAKGADLSDAEKNRLLSKMHEFTGLPPDFIADHHFRIGWLELARNLLGRPGTLLGRMDSTVVGIEPESSGRHPRYDPSLDPLFGPFSGAINHYVREELKFETDRVYEFLNEIVSQKWDWRSGLVREQGFVDVSHTLRDAMAVNEHLRVFIAAGRYDLATPYFAADYTVSHMWLGNQRANITMKYYEAGHMIYTHLEACRKLYRDVRAFYRP